MATDFQFPDVGEGIQEGVIVKWLVKVGDQVKQDQNIVQVETDKAVVDIPSPVSGTILNVNHKEGDTIKVGEVLATIGEKGESTTPKPTQAKPTAPVKETKPAKAPPGVVGELQGASGDWQALVGQRSESTQTTEKQPATKVAPILSKSAQTSTPASTETPETPKLQKTHEPQATPAQAKPSVMKKYDIYGYIDRIPFKGIRKTIAQNMLNSSTQKAMVTSMDDIDVTELWEIRNKDKKTAEKKKIKLTFLPYIIKALVQALKQHPGFGAYIKDEEIIIKKYYNIGIAVDTPAGLMVPVVKGVDQKDIYQIAKEIQDLAQKARDRKVDIMDLRGGSFTITNYGSVGGNYGTPIINRDESAILGLGRITEQPKIINGKLTARKILPISLTFDHQIVDGAEAAMFNNYIKNILENPKELTKAMNAITKIKTINPTISKPKKPKKKSKSKKKVKKKKR